MASRGRARRRRRQSSGSPAAAHLPMLLPSSPHHGLLCLRCRRRITRSSLLHRSWQLVLCRLGLQLAGTGSTVRHHCSSTVIVAATAISPAHSGRQCRPAYAGLFAHPLGSTLPACSGAEVTAAAGVAATAAESKLWAKSDTALYLHARCNHANAASCVAHARCVSCVCSVVGPVQLQEHGVRLSARCQARWTERSNLVENRDLSPLIFKISSSRGAGPPAPPRQSIGTHAH